MIRYIILYLKFIVVYNGVPRSFQGLFFQSVHWEGLSLLELGKKHDYEYSIVVAQMILCFLIHSKLIFVVWINACVVGYWGRRGQIWAQVVSYERGVLWLTLFCMQYHNQHIHGQESLLKLSFGCALCPLCSDWLTLKRILGKHIPGQTWSSWCRSKRYRLCLHY